MKRWIVGVSGVDIEVKALGMHDESGKLFFYVKDGDRNRNIASFEVGKWEYWMEEVV